MEEQVDRISVTEGTQTDERIWIAVGLGEEVKDTETVTVGAQTDESFWRPEVEDGELLPGLPNDITLDGIASKLPWSAFTVLSSVSLHWREAIVSRQVFNARVRSNSTETFIVIRSVRSNEISLYSIRDKSCYRLPRNPHLEGRGRQFSGITSVDGKIYVLGGLKEFDNGWKEVEKYVDPKDVYVFDPAGQRRWRQCPDMLETKHHVGCGVVNGKIYVFSSAGGRPEVYDPKLNAWSRIACMPSMLRIHKVLTLGEEMFLLGWHPRNPPPSLAYHTVKDEWRVVQHFPHLPWNIFIAQGKLHLMTGIGVDVLDGEKNTWQHLHSHSTHCLPEGADLFEVDDVIAVNGELFGATSRDIFGWTYHSSEPCLLDSQGEPSLLHSKGFCSDRDELLWQQDAAFPEDFTFECTVQI